MPATPVTSPMTAAACRRRRFFLVSERLRRRDDSCVACVYRSRTRSRVSVAQLAYLASDLIIAVCIVHSTLNAVDGRVLVFRHAGRPHRSSPSLSKVVNLDICKAPLSIGYNTVWSVLLERNEHNTLQTVL